MKRNCPDKTLRAEIHVHTTASDGSMSPDQLIKLAKKKHLDTIAITDHDTFRGASLALRISKLMNDPPLIIPGAEIRTVDHGDIIVLCQEPHEDYPKYLDELKDWGKENNCILIAAHPYHIGRHSMGKSIKENLDLIDAIEVWNSRGVPLLNYPAIRLAEETGKPYTSGSDVHVPRELGTSPILYCDDISEPADLFDLITSKKIIPVFGVPGPITLAEIVAWAIIKRLG